jgi:hypothetical protein
MKDAKVRVSRRPFDSKRHGFTLRPQGAFKPRAAHPFAVHRIVTGFAGEARLWPPHGRWRSDKSGRSGHINERRPYNE